MLQFKDLEFIRQESQERIQATLEIIPNVHLSVIAGPNEYSTPKSAIISPDEVISFEVGIRYGGAEVDWVVGGWKSREEITLIMVDLYIGRYLDLRR